MVGDRIWSCRGEKICCCARGQRQAAAMALRAACSGLGNTRNTHLYCTARAPWLETTRSRSSGFLPTLGSSETRWQTSSPRRRAAVNSSTAFRTSFGEGLVCHLSRVITENRSRATSQRISDHVRPERRYRPPAVSGLHRQALRRVRKALASRYSQLLSGHAAIGSFLHERMTGPPRRESSGCRWCNSSQRESRHRLFTECRAFTP